MRPYLVNTKIIQKMYKKKRMIKKHNQKIDLSSNFNFLIIIFIIICCTFLYYRYLDKLNNS